MPIEFRCTDCTALLRTPDDTAGRQAKCPKCGKVLMVPDAAAAAVVAAPLMPTPESQAERPSYQPPIPPLGRGSHAAVEYNPYQAPGAIDDAPIGQEDAGPIVPTKMRVFDTVGTIWRVHNANRSMGILALIVMILCMLPLMGLGFAVAATQEAARFNNLPLYLGIAIAQQLIGAVYGAFFWCGLTRFGLNASRGIAPLISDVFSGGKFVVRMILFQLLMLLTQIPMVVAMGVFAGSTITLLTIGAVNYTIFMYLIATYWPATALIVDRDLPFGEALRTSAVIARGNGIAFVLVMLIASVLAYLGFFLCFVGGLFTIPIWFYIMPATYLRMSGQRIAGDPV